MEGPGSEGPAGSKQCKEHRCVLAPRDVEFHVAQGAQRDRS